MKNSKENTALVFEGKKMEIYVLAQARREEASTRSRFCLRRRHVSEWRSCRRSQYINKSFPMGVASGRAGTLVSRPAWNFLVITPFLRSYEFPIFHSFASHPSYDFFFFFCINIVKKGQKMSVIKIRNKIDIIKRKK